MTRANVTPVKVLRKVDVWKQIAVPLSEFHLSLHPQYGWVNCPCALAQIIRKLDEMLMERPRKPKRKEHQR